MKSRARARLKPEREKSARALLMKAVYGGPGEYAFADDPKPPDVMSYVIVHEKPHYVAQCLDVDVSSFGGTIEEATEHLKEAVRLHYRPIPELLGTGRVRLHAQAS